MLMFLFLTLFFGEPDYADREREREIERSGELSVFP